MNMEVSQPTAKASAVYGRIFMRCYMRVWASSAKILRTLRDPLHQVCVPPGSPTSLTETPLNQVDIAKVEDTETNVQQELADQLQDLCFVGDQLTSTAEERATTKCQLGRQQMILGLYQAGQFLMACKQANVSCRLEVWRYSCLSPADEEANDLPSQAHALTQRLAECNQHVTDWEARQESTTFESRLQLQFNKPQLKDFPVQTQAAMHMVEALTQACSTSTRALCIDGLCAWFLSTHTARQRPEDTTAADVSAVLTNLCEKSTLEAIHAKELAIDEADAAPGAALERCNARNQRQVQKMAALPELIAATLNTVSSQVGIAQRRLDCQTEALRAAQAQLQQMDAVQQSAQRCALATAAAVARQQASTIQNRHTLGQLLPAVDPCEQIMARACADVTILRSRSNIDHFEAVLRDQAAQSRQLWLLVESMLLFGRRGKEQAVNCWKCNWSSGVLKNASKLALECEMRAARDLKQCKQTHAGELQTFKQQQAVELENEIVSAGRQAACMQQGILKLNTFKSSEALAIVKCVTRWKDSTFESIPFNALESTLKSQHAQARAQLHQQNAAIGAKVTEVSTGLNDLESILKELEAAAHETCSHTEEAAAQRSNGASEVNKAADDVTHERKLVSALGVLVRCEWLNVLPGSYDRWLTSEYLKQWMEYTPLSKSDRFITQSKATSQGSAAALVAKFYDMLPEFTLKTSFIRWKGVSVVWPKSRLLWAAESDFRQWRHRLCWLRDQGTRLMTTLKDASDDLHRAQELQVHKKLQWPMQLQFNRAAAVAVPQLHLAALDTIVSQLGPDCTDRMEQLVSMELEQGDSIPSDFDAEEQRDSMAMLLACCGDQPLSNNDDFDFDDTLSELCNQGMSDQQAWDQSTKVLNRASGLPDWMSAQGKALLEDSLNHMSATAVSYFEAANLSEDSWCQEMDGCTVQLPAERSTMPLQSPTDNAAVAQLRKQVTAMRNEQSCKQNQIQKAKERLAQLTQTQSNRGPSIATGNLSAFSDPGQRNLPLDELRSLAFYERVISWSLEHKTWAFIRWRMWMEAGWHVNEAEEAKEILLLASGGMRKLPRQKQKVPSSVRRKARVLDVLEQDACHEQDAC